MRRAGARAATVAVALVTVALAGCGGGSGGEANVPRTGKQVYVAYCLTCHGALGQGGVGPKLAGVMEQKYPNIEDQIAVVANGKGTMPAWGGHLSAAQIRNVVTYERTDLGK